MHLKKLELHGFKSFADKTEILFDQGVTCVVGPNGCGKSNISDSIRWVLGERSAKMLRGSKMEDVIFNGTDFRKSVAMAEVSLTIDNTDRGLPIDYQEVTLTRRLYRSGESEYYINRTLCRLKDLQDLILDTGIGSNSYSMIEQGRIDYVLNADAEERRFLIEEAAGISKFKVKKEEAIRKLERTEQNLLRLNDIVQEVHKNIQYAERQAKRAEKYKEQLELLKALEIKKSFFDLQVLDQEQQALEEKRQSCQGQIEQIESQKQQKRRDQEEQEALLKQVNHRYGEQESKRYGIRSQIDQIAQQLRFDQEKKVEFATRRGENQQEESQLNDQLIKGEQELAFKKAELQGLGDEKTQGIAQLKESETKFQQFQQNIENLKSQLQQSRLEAFEIASEVTRLRNDYHRSLAFLQTSGEQKTKLKNNFERFDHEKHEWELRKKAHETDIVSLEMKLRAIEQEIGRLEEDERRLKTEFEQALSEKEALQQKTHEKSAQLEMLKELDASSEVNKEKLLSKAAHLHQEFIGSMREVVRAKNGYELALEAALGIFAQSLIVEDVSTAKQLLTQLSQEKISNLTVLIRSQQQSQAVAVGQSNARLIDFVEIKPAYQETIRTLLQDVEVVEALNLEELDQWLSASLTRRVVTRDGIALGPGAQIFFRHGVPLEQSFFQRGKLIEDLQNNLNELRQSFEKNTETMARLDTERAERETRLSLLQEEGLDIKIQRESHESLSQGVEERLETYGRELAILKSEMGDLEIQEAEESQKKAICEEQLNQLSQKEQRVREVQDQLLREVESEEKKRDEALRQVTEWKAKLDHLQDRNRLLDETLQFLSEGDRRARLRIESLKQEMERIIEKEIKLEEEDARLTLQAGRLEEELRELEVTMELTRQEKNRTESEVTALQETLQNFTSSQQQLQDSLHQFEMKGMDYNYQRKTLLERMEQSYHIRLLELNREEYALQAEDKESVETKISELKNKVETIGAVNLLAIEEYDELKKRYDFLMSQKQDLEQAREELLEAIRKINRTTKSLFDETFANVQRTFQEYYHLLFRGGEAKLILLDETHPLESGIEIVVRPPGKKPQHITLLSGGEKALTAIALLFALFKIKPSPFCVLDEVDAPLDEANIDRFLTVLRTFLKTSQFIIVTHNRKTIAMGDALYGVTMEEAGISKLVSVKMNPGEKSLPGAALDQDQKPLQDSVTA